MGVKLDIPYVLFTSLKVRCWFPLACVLSMNQYENFARNGPGMWRKRYHAWKLEATYHAIRMAGKNGRRYLNNVPRSD
jgi:hypothetical protein